VYLHFIFTFTSIFGDAPSNYSLDVGGRTHLTVGSKVNYFQDEPIVEHKDLMEVDDDEPAPQNPSIANLLVSAGLDSSHIKSDEKKIPNYERTDSNSRSRSSIRKDRLQPLEKKSIDPMSELDPYSADIMDFSDDDDEGNPDENDSEQVDLGTRKNKKKQLSRFDFDDEEQWQSYKLSQCKIPKAAFAFRVKAADGGGGAGSLVKKAMKGKQNDKEKINRDMQSIEKIIKEKYSKK